MPEGVHQQDERGRELAAAWIAEVVAGEGRAPVVEHPHQASVRQKLAHSILEHERQAQAVDRRIQDQPAVTQGELALDADAKLSATLSNPQA